MASPKVAPKQQVDRPAAEAHGNPGLRAQDITLERMSLLHKVSKVFDSSDDHDFRPGDIVIGDGQAPDDLTKVYARGAAEGVRFLVMSVKVNLTLKYGVKPGEAGPGPWDIDDPDAPPNAGETYHYHLCVPAYDTDFPVLYSMSSSATRVARKINKSLYTQCEEGPIYGVCFELHTEQNTRGENTWTSPIVKRVEPTQDELDVAAALYARITPPVRHVAEIEAGDNGSGPAY